MDNLCLVFRSQARPFLAVPTIILYGDGIMDERFRDNPDSLSFLEFNHFDVDGVGTSKDMPTFGTKIVADAGWHSCHAIMVYG
jgi:hypothetical protein